MSNLEQEKTDNLENTLSTGNIVTGIGVVICNQLGEVLTVSDRVTQNQMVFPKTSNGIVKDRKRHDILQDSIPFGKSRQGENKYQTAKREIEEETGLNITQSELEYLGTIHGQTPSNLIAINILRYGEEIQSALLNGQDYFKQEIAQRNRTEITELLEKNFQHVRVPTFEAILLVLGRNNPKYRNIIKDILEMPIPIKDGMYANEPIKVKKSLEKITKNGYH